MALAGKDAVAGKAPIPPVIRMGRFNSPFESDEELARAVQPQGSF